MTSNIDHKTVAGFGDEWSRFDQSALSEMELEQIFEQYFAIFPWTSLPDNSTGFDLGCGSGRWARLVADRVGQLHCIDASEKALNIARMRLSDKSNCVFHHASVDAIPHADGSMDFGYSLGVLHHVPDTQEGITACVRKLKPGAPFLLYLYYAFDNRPLWFIILWKLSDFIRLLISRLPHTLRYWTTQIIAGILYYPLARTAAIFEKAGLDVSSFPLSYYRNQSFYTMRTDALDRFGTRLEQRYTAKEIKKMMEDAGLERIVFGDSPPYWCALGFRKCQVGSW
jgi:ubiquinone/menaquinone biosynthesis C-methylase UbiE